MTRHIVIPDTQCKPDDDMNYLTAIGRYIVKMKPDVIVHLGDHADMQSLSSYDVGKKSFEGRRYVADVQASHEGMQALLTPLWEYNENARKTKHKLYNPKMEFLTGNHEQRINRAVEDDAKLDGVLSIKDLGFEEYGWNVHNFLDVAVVDGVAYSHYFVTGTAGRPASTAAAQFRKTNMSCVAGHQQGLQIHTGSRADGKRLTSIIAGSSYTHAEGYMGPQGNKHWRGILVLHDVDDGEFDLMPVSTKWLLSKYGD